MVMIVLTLLHLPLFDLGDNLLQFAIIVISDSSSTIKAEVFVADVAEEVVMIPPGGLSVADVAVGKGQGGVTFMFLQFMGLVFRTKIPPNVFIFL
jgi:hypothetical protein